MNHVLVVVGTRPELVKMAPVVRALEDHEELSFELVHTGQHYDEELSDTFIETLGLPEPSRYLGVGSASHSRQTADALAAIGETIAETDPEAVLAQGDTNTVLAAALAASKSSAKFGHVEAGIRSFDRSMPEEVNRVLADHVVDWAFAPTEAAADNLASEGIEDDETVFVTGNTVVDACRRYSAVAEQESTVLDEFDLTPGEYVVATIHRQRNTDETDRLGEIMEALDGADAPVVLPAHPRLRNALEASDVRPEGSLRLIDPLGYLDFLRLQSAARLVVTDSGGIQEEAAVLEVPCLTVRPNTERPETVEAGVNELVAPADLAERLAAVYESEADSMVGEPDLYGDGDAGERVAEILATDLS